MIDVALSADATRMLLAGDGSTTTLLEALLNCPLSVRVDAQGPVPAHVLDSRAVRALGLAAGEQAVLRHSALLTPGGDVVSVNTVAFTVQPSGWSASASDSTPLGQRLREAGSKQHRTILTSGLAEWPGDDRHQPCAFKEYVISCADGSRIYVFEKFNPAYVSAAESDRDLEPAGS
ncbi:hypothetical protein [Streptomyces sp. NPDC002889]|uniref:hypothetical protein n=1 Tax=Streptomyces sp. NPDC002889 TaxID=3364669 RepID=UPI0036D09850